MKLVPTTAAITQMMASEDNRRLQGGAYVKGKCSRKTDLGLPKPSETVVRVNGRGKRAGEGMMPYEKAQLLPGSWAMLLKPIQQRIDKMVQ